MRKPCYLNKVYLVNNDCTIVCVALPLTDPANKPIENSMLNFLLAIFRFLETELKQCMLWQQMSITDK